MARGFKPAVHYETMFKCSVRSRMAIWESKSLQGAAEFEPAASAVNPFWRPR
jgi:hypothetical protein